MNAFFSVLAGAASAGAPAAEPSPPEPKRPTVFIRPHGGVGWASSYTRRGHGVATHAGARFLLSAGPAQRFGLEISYVQLDVRPDGSFDQAYVVPGLVLEMILFEHFNLGIGTIGYVGVAGERNKPFGVVTNLGWEPVWDHVVRPFVTLRTEWIFDRDVFNVLSLSAGITFAI